MKKHILFVFQTNGSSGTQHHVYLDLIEEEAVRRFFDSNPRAPRPNNYRVIEIDDYFTVIGECSFSSGT